MSNPAYNWKRFWCPRTGHLNLSDDGYMVDPDSEWGRFSNPDVVSFETIVNFPCLGFLGEPGMGKTHTMQAQRAAIDRQVSEEGGRTLWLDLRSYGSEDRLIRGLFANPTLTSWANASYPLHIFLDSLDECLLRINTLATLLVDEFQKYSNLLERLYLRIACRTAEWPGTLEKGLQALWGEEAVGVYELAPLRRVDVVEAAKANGLDANALLREIDRTAVVSFVTKPVTLGFLLNIYRGNGRFPSTQTELYRQGCHLLCEEPNASRRDARLRGALSAEQRMVVAARIAAVTIFANRYAIWTGLDLGNVPNEDVPVRELCIGRETASENDFEVSEAAVKETLTTGLFSSRGPQRMGWVHQSYAEFLAAQYLAQPQMTPVQMMSLLIHPDDPARKVVPQLHETAAWLAGIVSTVFQDIMRTNPDVLLRSDVATADGKDRAALVESLLKQYDEEQLLDSDWDVRSRYGKLAHPDVTEQLRPYICDATKGIVVRNVAVDIAEACKLQTLQSALADIALDPSQPQPIRVNCAFAVSRIGDGETKAGLKPLAIGEAGDDPDDELKGCGLRAVWPAHMTAEELFAVLTSPKREALSGMYELFLSSELVPHLEPVDLPEALKWVEVQQPRHELPYPFTHIIDAIMLKGWECLESPGVLEAFARAALSRLKHDDDIVEDRHKPPLSDVLTNDDEKRRQVLEAMLPMLSDSEKDWVWPIWSHPPLVLSKDVPWMVERFQAAKSHEIQIIWVQLISRAYDLREPGQLEAVFAASQKSAILADAFVWLLRPVELNSPEAEKMRANYLGQQRRQTRERPLLEPPPAKRIALLLEACESGNSAAWWRLNREMTLEPDSTHYRDELEGDLTVLPGWKATDPTIKARILAAAKRYVLEHDANPREWLGRSLIHRPAFAGYRALRLLLQEDPQFVSTIPATVWEKWASIILAYPTSSGTGNEGPHQLLVKRAYKAAPEEIIATLIVLIDKEDREHGYIFITRQVGGCWDDRLAEALLAKAKDETLKPESMGSLLGDLLAHGVGEARAFAESFVPLPPPCGGAQRARAIVAARMLMTHADDAGWPVVWPAIQQETEFGRELISGVGQSLRRQGASVGQKLAEDQLANLYLWLAHQYPYAEDPHHEGGSVGPRESVANWRDALLRQLKERGTPEACLAIRRIMQELPDLGWLKWVLLEAQNITRRRTWVPPQPGDILKMAGHHELRLVQSGDQLLEVLIESLKRLEAKLQGETPAAQFLWDKVNRHAWRPKDENSFSDYVKIHLDEDLRQRGVIVNREVEIRRGFGPGQGERTDIHVDAVVRGSQGEVHDSVMAIIEVKGCWNPELKHAMKAQLVDRYLQDNRCHHGVYLVGWFNCNQWDERDYRKRQAPKISTAEARHQFDAQATELSEQGTRIKAVILHAALR